MTLGLYLADLKETWDVLGIKHLPSPYCSHRVLVPSDQFGEPALDITPHLRTEADTIWVSRSYAGMGMCTLQLR